MISFSRLFQAKITFLMGKDRLENSIFTRHSKSKRYGGKWRVIYPVIEQEVGGIVKRYVDKELQRKLWKIMITFDLKRHST